MAAKDDTEAKLRKLIAETVEEVIGSRDKRQRSDSESKEVKQLREIIREEVGGFFEEFVKGFDEGKADKERDEPDEEPEGTSILRAVFGGGGRK